MVLTYPDPPLRDGVVGLRAWQDRDVACVRQAASDPRIPGGTTVPAIYTYDDALAFIERQRWRLVAGEGISQAITDVSSDRAVGLLWLGGRPQAGVLGLGYWVVPDARRRGFGV